MGDSGCWGVAGRGGGTRHRLHAEVHAADVLHSANAHAHAHALTRTNTLTLAVFDACGVAYGAGIEAADPVYLRSRSRAHANTRPPSLFPLFSCSLVHISGAINGRPEALPEAGAGVHSPHRSSLQATAGCGPMRGAGTCPSAPVGVRWGWGAAGAGAGARQRSLVPYRRGGPQLGSGFGEAAERIRKENKAKEEAAKADKKKREAAKIQEQVKMRRKAQEATKKAAQEEDAQRRAAAAAKRAKTEAEREIAGVPMSRSITSRGSMEGEEEEEDGGGVAELSDAAKQLVETLKLYRSQGKTFKLLGLMDEAMALDTEQDRTAAAGAVVQALLACGRASLACQVVERAEGENLRLAPKLIVSVAKAVSIEQPRTAPPKKSGRVRGQKKLILLGSQEEEFDADDGVGGGQDGVDKCLLLAALLQGRGGSSDWARARVYAAVVTGQLRAGRLGAAKATVEILRQLPVSLTLGAYKSMMREFARIQSLQGLLLVLDVMRHFGVEADAEVLEQVANVAVHEVEFVKGAVDMDTLPPEGVPEACFAGRSNVGKSSLVNMMCNRKKLAFTSKTPGKTQEFNYFLVSGGRAQGAGAEAEKNVFHLVDLPGVGYAEVPTFKREAWKQFYRDYLSRRRSLRVLFQLVDSRHGALKDDLELMSLVSEVGVAGGGAKPFEHVIVLTKMDKREGMDVTAVLEMVRKALLVTGCDPERTPIVFTSSSSKLGRDEMWRYLRLAAGMGEEEDVVQLLEPDAALRKRVATEGEGGEGSKVKKRYQNAPKFKGLGKLLKKINPKT